MPPTAPDILTCDRLSIGYPDRLVLSDLTIHLAAGQFVSLLGPNGAGKTTLLRTLSRHLAPLSGRITVTGRNLADLPAMTLAKTMAVVLTDRIAPPLFSVFEFVALGRYPHTNFLGRLGKQDLAAVQKALAAVRADHLAARPFSDLSDGERQKALVARALAQEPRILLLDEPTVHLDLKHRVEVMAILRDLCRTRGITVVASLHDVDVAAKISDQVALIKDGLLWDLGPPETVLTGRVVADLYDFNGADFDRHLGGIELRGDGRRGRAFVVAGLGSGTLVYRLLAKQGFAIATGVVPTNDIDYFVARSLGADCLVHSPMQPADDTTLQAAARCMAGCDVVIDSGFAVGPWNQGNLHLLQTAAANGQAILSLRGQVSNELPYPAGHAVVACSDAVALLKALNRFSDSPDQEARIAS